LDVLWQAGAASEPALRVIAQRSACPDPLTDPLDLELMIDGPLAWPVDELIFQHSVQRFTCASAVIAAAKKFAVPAEKLLATVLKGGI
jgi:hypothetical protein